MHCDCGLVPQILSPFRVSGWLAVRNESETRTEHQGRGHARGLPRRHPKGPGKS